MYLEFYYTRFPKN